MSTGAIILAAGRSERMGGIDKVLHPTGARPLISESVETFARAGAVDALVVVASSENREAIEAAVREAAPAAKVVIGGKRRRDSVMAGLEALADCELVIIHDGARPLVDERMIDDALAAARESGAALCAIPVTDTVKREGEGGFVRGTISRVGLWLAQTPQAFRRDLLLRAHAAFDIDATDDAALVELLEQPVRIVMGSQRNIKVTTPEDLALAEALIRMRG